MTTHQNNRPTYEELKDWLSVASEVGDIDAALSRFAAGHGFRWFSYLWLQDANIRGLSNYPSEWQEHYLANGLAHIDPIIGLTRRARGAFSWVNNTDVRVESRQQSQFMRDAAQVGIQFGYTIPIEGGYSTRAALTLSGPERCDTQNLLLDQFVALSTGAFLHGFLERSSDVVFQSGECPLTVYQLECLAWLAQGKRNSDIAAIRRVSTRAVDAQINAIKNKLGTETSAQSVAIAVQRKWVLV